MIVGTNGSGKSTIVKEIIKLMGGYGNFIRTWKKDGKYKIVGLLNRDCYIYGGYGTGKGTGIDQIGSIDVVLNDLKTQTAKYVIGEGVLFYSGAILDRLKSMNIEVTVIYLHASLYEIEKRLYIRSSKKIIGNTHVAKRKNYQKFFEKHKTKYPNFTFERIDTEIVSADEIGKHLLDKFINGNKEKTLNV